MSRDEKAAVPRAANAAAEREEERWTPSLFGIWHKAKKPENIWFRIFYAFSTPLVYVAARRKLHPNQLTTIGFLLNSLALASFLSAGKLTALTLFFFAHVFDCADGHLAFVTEQRSRRGQWLDSAVDVTKIAMFSACLMMSALDAISIIGPSRILTLFVLLAGVGNLVNYCVSMAAKPFLEIIDLYSETGIGLRVDKTAIAGRLVAIAVSHSREYGNALVVFAALTFLPKFGLFLLLAYGGINLALACNRILRVARQLRD